MCLLVALVKMRKPGFPGGADVERAVLARTDRRLLCHDTHRVCHQKNCHHRHHNHDYDYNYNQYSSLLRESISL